MIDHAIKNGSSGLGCPDVTFGNSDFRLSIKRVSEDEISIRLTLRRENVRKIRWESEDGTVQVMADVNSSNDPYNGYLSMNDVRCIKKVDKGCRRDGNRLYTVTVNNELEYIFEDAVDDGMKNRNVTKSVTSYHKEIYFINIYESVIARI